MNRHEAYYALWKDLTGYFQQFGFMNTSSFDRFVADVITPNVPEGACRGDATTAGRADDDADAADPDSPEYPG